MYPYVLGIHFKSKMLCRLPHPVIANFIPQGFGRVVQHRRYAQFKERTITFSGSKVIPYEHLLFFSTQLIWDDVELDPKYHVLFRWQDLQRRFNEPITGPNIMIMLVPDAKQQLD